MRGAPGAPGMAQAAVLGDVGEDEGKGGLGRRQPGGLVEGRAGGGEGRDHQAVPVGEHLVVPLRRHARRAGGEQPGAASGQHLLQGRVAQPPRRAAVEDGPAFPVAAGGDVVGPLERRGVVAENGVDLVPGPNVVLALDALAVGVEGAGEGENGCIAAGPVGRIVHHPHLAQGPVDGFAHADGVERVVGVQPGRGQQLDKQGVVIEHLLEVGHQPPLVGGIPGKAAAQVIVNAALAHGVQGHRDRLAQKGRTGPPVSPPQEPEKAGLGKFRRARGAAVQGVDQAAGSPGGLVQELDGEAAAAGRPAQPGQGLADRGNVLQHHFILIVERFRYGLQQVGERGPAEVGRRGKIGAAPERLALGSEKHGQGPSALGAHQGQRGLVDGVQIGSLLAVHLDVDEQAVHHPGDGLVLETLVGHDVAPVAGGVSDGQQDGLVLALGEGEGFRVPGPPVDGVVLVLQ